jgi:plastocyanin
MAITAQLVRVAAAAAVLAATLPASAVGGTIKGRVDVKPRRYLEDTVVYLKDVKGSYPPRSAALDQKGMRFVPHIAIITPGSTVKFLNHDNVVHNVYSLDGERYDLGYFKQDEERTYTFEKPGVYAQRCRIHPEMLGYVFVGQNPYAAAVDRKGAYEIDDVPPGKYTLAVWNAKLAAPEKTVTVTAGGTLEESFTLEQER